MAEFQTPANWNVTSTHTIFKINPTDSSVITTFGITDVRNSITALFVVLNFLLAVAGGACVKSKARRIVAHGETVPVIELTSWLGLSDVAKYTWSLHILPGGWLGWLMIFTGVVGVIHQFLTNTLVTPTLVPTRCIFDYGCVPPGGTSTSPPANDDVVFRSQLATLTNGGTRGIYSRFLSDNEIQMFRPDPSDTYGAWNCKNIRNDTLPWTGHASFYPPASGVTLNDMEKFWNTTAYVYRSGAYAMFSTSVTNTETEIEYISGFLIWSSPSQTDMSTIRASILNLQLFLGKTVEAMDFECTLTLNQPVPPMDVQQVLQAWSSPAAGYQSSQKTVQGTALWLELSLDAITTESIFNTNINPTNIVPPQSIGCVVQGTQISIAILGILMLIAVVVLALLVAVVCLHLASLRAPMKHGARELPFDLADWQLAAYHQGQRQTKLTQRKLQAVGLLYDNSKGQLRMDSETALPRYFEPQNNGAVEYNTNFGVPMDMTPLQSHKKPVIQPYVQVPSSTDLGW